ncbi:MAG: AAA family ATPase [Thermoanaerobaculales bacterium]|jgi:AAA+ superfamily predicted ATPase|nr:AAA family ATPase [Thermoanaerobaculales bacterium]
MPEITEPARGDGSGAGGSAPLPSWAEEMRGLFRSGSAGQFVLHGNVRDLVPATGADGATRFLPLGDFLAEVMLAPFEVVIFYDRGRGLRVPRGGDHFHRFLKAFDSFRGTGWASLPEMGDSVLDLGGLLPRDPRRALEIVNRFLRGSQHRTRRGDDGELVADPLRVAVVIDYAHFLAPRGEPVHFSSDLSQTLIQLLDWAADPSLAEAFVATVLVTENLTDLHPLLVESSYNAKIAVSLPSSGELGAFLHHLVADRADAASAFEMTVDELAARLVGLTRVAARSLVLQALGSGRPLTVKTLSRMKKELIEKEAAGRISFVESARTLDDVAGHDEAKQWLRQDAELLRRGVTRAIPMGYLLCGRIGTGKTYLVECWAGEIGIPVVALRNFRERWVGATEGNLEKVFTILRALGQVVVFVDEADQMTGKRDSGTGDSGLSGRVYGMLAKEMSDTSNRGKIIWVFATSRPDLVEVDLKRQGRLDVHIPLFPPGDAAGRRALFAAMARKVGLPVAADELPELPDDAGIGGNEMEGILVRALRVHATQAADGGGRSLVEIIADAAAEVRPSAHTERLELMDLVAVKECTDTRFLPVRYRTLSLAEVNRRIDELRRQIGE